MKKLINIKQQSKLYDRVYDIADKLIKKHNPCNIHTHRGVLCCAEYKYNKYYKNSKLQRALCCANCNDSTSNKRKSYWSKEGCTTKCIACKLFYCHYVTNKPLIKALRKLNDYSKKHLIQFKGHNYKQPIIWKYYFPKDLWLKNLEQQNKQIRRSNERRKLKSNTKTK
jgi:hypothetical protein